MSSGKVIIAGVFVLVATAAMLLRSFPIPVPDREIVVRGAPDSVTDQLVGRRTSVAKAGTNGADARALYPVSAKALSPADERRYLQAPPLSKEEVKSVKKLFETFFRNSRGKNSLNKLIRELRMSGLDPVMARDFNPYTGKMLTIRTNEALEGTRYFHAQFFADDSENKEPFRQHLSFEIRPSPDAMRVAQKIVEEKLGKALGTPIRVRKDEGHEWVEWKKDGESIWIQRLGAEDLNHDPLNARTIEDIGTVRAAVELIPSEGHDDRHGAGTVH